MKLLLEGLYAIVDVDSVERLGLDVLSVARAVLAGGAGAVQLRAKDRAPAQTLAWLRALGSLAQQAGVPLIANDRADLAELAGCVGVHVGQEDLPPAEVRRAFPSLAVGVSTHGLAQLVEALAQDVAYVALGPVFETRSKKNPDPVVGLDLLERGAALASVRGLPLVAIGGITEATAATVAATGAVPAVIGAVLPSSAMAPAAAYREIERRTERLSRAVQTGSLRSGADG